jgi:hypothetical protein
MTNENDAAQDSIADVSDSGETGSPIEAERVGILKSWSRDPMLVAALITVFANVVIAIGAVAVVLVQGSQLSGKHDAQLSGIQDMLRSSNSMREALQRPMEGWYEYHVPYNVFHNLPRDESDPLLRFDGRGVAVLEYNEGGGYYEVLVSYYITNGYDFATVGATTSGYTTKGIVLQPGDTLNMGYEKRLGLPASEIPLPKTVTDEQRARFTVPVAKESKFEWVIESVEQVGANGMVDSFTAKYKGSASTGTVVFKRRSM